MQQPILSQIPKPVVLIILDGLGVAPASASNAVTIASPKNLEDFWQKYPHCYLQAAGNSVGLPSGVVGNSEVGHMNIGAGKVIFQEIAKIDKEIENKFFLDNKVLKNAVDHVKTNKGKLHLIGLVSNGRVHSSIDHLTACLEFCQKERIASDRLFIHAFTDGRDTPPQSASKFLGELEVQCKKFRVGRIASIIGRYFAMDRDNRWERTKKAYDLIVSGVGEQVVKWQDALKSSYEQKKTDEFIEPYVIVSNGQPITTITSGDAVVFFNYRADRAVQISKAFEDDPFNGWQRNKISNVFFAGFSNYEKGIPMTRAKEDTEIIGGESEMVKSLFSQELVKSTGGFPENQVFPPEKISLSLGKLISDRGLKQLRITESEKFPHVTYFFNCREKNPFPGENRIEIPSPKNVSTYDQKPEMSSFEVTKTLIQKINENIYDFILVNYAASDMVPHTGNLDASVKAVQVVDQCMGEVVKAVLSKQGVAIITADHGNAEELINLQTGNIDTEHSTNPVPFILVSNEHQARELNFGLLADIAPTILAALKIAKPPSMTGRNLLL